jgi:hypothetical protein
MAAYPLAVLDTRNEVRLVSGGREYHSDIQLKGVK